MGGEGKFPTIYQPGATRDPQANKALGPGILDEFDMPAMSVEQAIEPPVANPPPAPIVSADAEPGAEQTPRRRAPKPPAARAPSPEKQGPHPLRTRLHALPAEPWPKEPTKTRVDDCIVDALWQLEGWLPGILKGQKGFGADDITMMCFALYRSRDTFSAGEYSAPHSNALLAKLADKGRSYWTHGLIEKTYVEGGARYRLTTDGRAYLSARERRQLSPDELKNLFETAKRSILISPLDRYHFTR